MARWSEMTSLLIESQVSQKIVEATSMKRFRTLSLLGVLSLATAAAAKPPQTQQQPPPPTVSLVMDREISAVEKQILDVAEAMPEDKYNFSPESLNIPGSDYKGTRTFAVQLKH